MAETGIGTINLKVLVYDPDYYALNAINSYLAWDRRTRVKAMCETLDAMWTYLDRTPIAELPDMAVIDADHVGGAQALANVIQRLHETVKDIKVICLSQTAAPELIVVAAEAGVRAFLLKQEVRLRIAWALVYALEQEFVITSGIHRAAASIFNSRVFHAVQLPEQRDYPEMTDRIQQALRLCVVKGMPAHLAADEMGISLHTIRGYIKEGYRILESYDETEYPIDMTPQERAFMRFTALEDDEQRKE